jgi:hypothetical protein
LRLAPSRLFRTLNMSDIDYEKNQYAVGNTESPDHGIKSIVAEKGNNIGEAADLYGDVGLWSFVPRCVDANTEA